MNSILIGLVGGGVVVAILTFLVYLISSKSQEIGELQEKLDEETEARKTEQDMTDEMMKDNDVLKDLEKGKF